MTYSSLNLRHEHKYLLSRRDYFNLKDALSKVMSKDKHTINNEGYHIRSLYFDDEYNTAAFEKTIGCQNRRKFRIRIYNFSEKVIKLEIKQKYNDYIRKLSYAITNEEYNQMLSGKIDFLAQSKNQVLSSYYLEMRNSQLKPAIIVDYKREAFVMPYNQIRITFDKELAAARPEKNIFNKTLGSYQIGSDYSIILEVKYNNFLPNYLKRIIEMYASSKLAVSKYLLCRQYLDI